MFIVTGVPGLLGLQALSVDPIKIKEDKKTKQSRSFYYQFKSNIMGFFFTFYHTIFISLLPQ